MPWLSAAICDARTADCVWQTLICRVSVTTAWCRAASCGVPSGLKYFPRAVAAAQPSADARTVRRRALVPVAFPVRIIAPSILPHARISSAAVPFQDIGPFTLHTYFVPKQERPFRALPQRAAEFDEGGARCERESNYTAV